MRTEIDATSLGVVTGAMPADLILQVPEDTPSQELSYQEAIREALREEMLRDDTSSFWKRTSEGMAGRLASPGLSSTSSARNEYATPRSLRTPLLAPWSAQRWWGCGLS